VHVTKEVSIGVKKVQVSTSTPVFVK